MERRNFLKKATLASGVALLPSTVRAQSPSNRIVTAVIGIHDRGMDLAEELATRKDVEIRYLADPDSNLFAERQKRIEEWSGKKPTCVQDFRKVLEDPEVDAVAIATPDHWHALATIWACQAGKHVYVEKPVAHNIREGRQMVEASRKYNRVVQVGTQNRSADYIRMAHERIRSGELGDIHFVRVVNSKMREPMPKLPDEPVPEGVDYNLWLGPASERPFNPNRFHYTWHWYWEYSGGDIINDGVHQTDLARWLTGKSYPKTITSSGGGLFFRDEQETPDTQSVLWEFDDLLMVFEQTLWTPYMKKIPFELRDKDYLPNWPFSGTRVEIYGAKQFMFLGRMGGGWQIFDGEGEVVKTQHGKFSPANTAHMANFIESIRGNEKPNADVEEGHLSTLLGHAGNIAFRVGQKLVFNPETESFVGNDAANALLAREYRKPFTLSEKI